MDSAQDRRRPRRKQPKKIAVQNGRFRLTESNCIRISPRVDFNEELIQVLAKKSFFPEFLFRKSEKLQPREKTRLFFCSVFFRVKQKFRYKGVEGQGAAPLELCHHSGANKTQQDPFQGHWQVMGNRRKRSEFLSSLRRVDMTAPRRPTERAR